MKQDDLRGVAGCGTGSMGRVRKPPGSCAAAVVGDIGRAAPFTSRAGGRAPGPMDAAAPKKLTIHGLETRACAGPGADRARPPPVRAGAAHAPLARRRVRGRGVPLVRRAGVRTGSTVLRRAHARRLQRTSGHIGDAQFAGTRGPAKGLVAELGRGPRRSEAARGVNQAQGAIRYLRPALP